MKKRNVVKSRATSLKGWRVRRHMQQARKQLQPELSETISLFLNREFVDPQPNWPAYMKHALPNPWLSNEL